MDVDPSGCAGYIVDIHGAAGAEWLARLPALLDGCARRWSLTVLPPFEHLSYHYVAPAVRADGSGAVIKAGVPDVELRREIDALRWVDGEGMVRLLAVDIESGILLLERLVPGTPLTAVAGTDEIVDVACRVLRQLWKPVRAGHSFDTVEGWAGGLAGLRAHFRGGYGPFPPALVDRAAGLYGDLLRRGAEPMLLHGDLHPQNVLRAEREPWLAIDPKGVVGDPLCDAAILLCGLAEDGAEADLRAALDRATRQIAERLDFDRRLLVSWALAHCVLSGWWSYEDHGRGWEWAFTRAEVLASLL